MTTQHGIRCVGCGDELYSNSTHDFVTCSCNASFIDGGFSYKRVGWDEKVGLPTDITREVDRATLSRYYSNEHTSPAPLR